MKKPDRETLLRLVRYFVIGVATTLVSWGSYALLEKVMNLNAANALSWVLAVAFAFVANKIYVFRSRSWEKKTWLREGWTFLSARIATGVIEIGGVPLLMWMGLDQTLLGTRGMAAKVLVTVLVQVLNYVFSRLLVFKKS